MIQKILSASWPDGALFVLRLFFGTTMALAHALPKFQRFSELQSSFPDPLGIGNQVSLLVVLFAEFVCAIAVLFGFLFRFSLVPLIITMGVAAFVIHAPDPFQKQELALAYLAVYVCLLLSGPGRYSLDSFLARRHSMTDM